MATVTIPKKIENELKSASQTKNLPVEEISLKSPMLRFGFSLAMVFILLITGIVFGQESFKNVSEYTYYIVGAAGDVVGQLVDVDGLLKEYGQWLASGVEEIGRKIQEGAKSFVQAIKEIPRLVITKPFKEKVVKEEVPFEISEKEIEELRTEIKKLKEEGIPAKEIIKEITRITQVEPIKEITKETVITKIDEKELAKIKKELSSFALWGADIENLRAITQKLQAHPAQTPVATAPIYIGSQGIQVGGTGQFASLGVSGSAGVGSLGVGGSASIGSTASDKLTVAATSEFNAPVFAKAGLTVGTGTLNIDKKGNLTTTGKITVKSDLIVDGALQFAGTTRITNAGAATFTDLTTPLVTSTLLTLESTGGILTLRTTATVGVDDIVFSPAGAERFRILENGDLFFERGAFDVILTVAAPAAATRTYTIPDFGANVSFVGTNRIISAGTGLTGGGDLSADRTLAVLYGSTAGTAVQGNITLTCPSGTGNLTGGGTVITLGAGGTCASIDTIANPSFTSVTLSGTTPLTLTGASPVTIARDTATTDILAIDNLGIGTLSLNLVDGGLRTAGTERLTNAGVLTNITGITSSGTITFSGLTADRLVTTTTGGALATSISSANLALSVTDETGSGLLVFGTSPSFTTSVVTGSTSFDLFNTTATTINAFGAATALTIGATSGTTTIRNTNLALSADSAVLNFSSITGTKQIQTGGTTHLALMPGGNVGIGTTVPLERLTITGNARLGQAPVTLTTLSVAMTATDTTATVVSTTGYPSAGTLLIGSEAMTYTGTTATTFTGLTRGALGTTATTHALGATVNNYLQTILATTTTPRMVITGSGNVGIGTATPSSLLHVYNRGDAAYARIQGISDGDNYAGIELWSREATPRKWQLVQKSITGQTYNFNIAHFNGTSWSTPFAITTGGNVGIGTTGPGRRLEVLQADSVPQLRLSQSATVFSELFIDSAGDLRVSATGQDIRALDENLWVCAGGACPSISISGTGNLVIEGDVYAAGYRRASCPTGMIEVPPSPQDGMDGFCVDKYEAKNVGGMATSQAAGTPWVSIAQFNARAECIRAGKHLITEKQWQAIAHNIERVGWNWNGGVVGTNQMSDGHSDNAPAGSLAADVTGDPDDDPCVGTGQACSLTVWDSQRRTYRLSNGQHIWDFGGNVWEWVDQVNEDEYPVHNSPIAGWVACSATGDGICGNTLTTNDRWVRGGTLATRGFLRGGAWHDGASPGAFTLALSNAPADPGTHIGFRCAR